MKIMVVNKENIEGYNKYLRDDMDVEVEFMRILENQKNAFKDEESLALMKEIDGAIRKGAYGVETPFAKSCISCLSTGCKFGLVVLYYLKKNPDLDIFIKWEIAGDNVWEWLIEHTDAVLYVFEEDMNYLFLGYDKLEVLYENVCYEGVDIWDVINKCNKNIYDLTKEKESKAYDRYQLEITRSKKVFCDLKEEISLEQFVERFSNKTYCTWDEEWEVFKDYTVINYCNSISDDFFYRKLPLYVWGKTENEMETFITMTVKYPRFLEILYDDVLGDYVEEPENHHKSYYKERYESWFVLVLEEEEVCPIKDYPDKTIMGIEVNRLEKKITILNAHQAVERFHELYIIYTNGYNA